MTDGKHVLIIDDDEDFSRLLSVYLARAGYKTTVAPDGIQGHLAANRDKPDVIIIDYQMPAASGVTVVERLKRTTTTASIPILMLTGFRTKAIEDSARQAGVIAVMSKNDLTEERLLNALDTALAGGTAAASDLDSLFPTNAQ